MMFLCDVAGLIVSELGRAADLTWVTGLVVQSGLRRGGLLVMVLGRRRGCFVVKIAVCTRLYVRSLVVVVSAWVAGLVVECRLCGRGLLVLVAWVTGLVVVIHPGWIAGPTSGRKYLLCVGCFDWP